MQGVNTILAIDSFLGVSEWNNRYVRAVVGLLTELNDAVFQRKQRVIFAHADVFTGVMLGAALANDDVSSDATLAAINLDAEPFTF